MLSLSPPAETAEIEENFTEGKGLPRLTFKTDSYKHVSDRLATLTVVQRGPIKIELISYKTTN
jgi:hypothetical protein